MSLLSRRCNASATQMLRSLTALLIAVLLSSHGTMGMAAPHADRSVHTHVMHDSHDVEKQTSDADHGTEVSDVDSNTGGSTESDAAHAHPAADQIPPAGMILASCLFGDMSHAGLVVTPLRSADQSPLLEPPSA